MFCQIKNDCSIGIFGGTFNPIHNAHVEIARQARRELKLDKVIVMPSGNPPHKRGVMLADEKQRCEMVKLAISEYPELEFSDYEVTKQGYSYTSETLSEFSDIYPDIHLIIGADSFFMLEKWHCPETIMRLAAIAVANRGDRPYEELCKYKRRLIDMYNARIEFIHSPNIPVSSSDIRARIEAGKPVDNMLNPKVLEYIKANNLYGSRACNAEV